MKIRSLLFLALGFLALLPAAALAGDDQGPNVLLIMTDDQGYGDLGFHGNDLIETPVLDRLARESTRFEHFMVSPLCSMTRATLLTGRYNLRTGCASVTRGLETVRPEEVTIAEVLKGAGYATGCFGKWHIGENYPSHPNGQGFDEFLGMPQGHWDDYFDPELEHNGRRIRTEGYITDVLTDAAMEFIHGHRDEPFFCYLPYNAPHTPMQISDDYFDKYRARVSDDKVAAIYGMVQNIDENVGRLLALLDELHLSEKTIVIFLSDNGAEGPEGSRYNAGIRGMKGTVHEGGVRVPFFVRWPGHVEADRSLEQLAAHIDVLPTLAELCGATGVPTKPLDGRSLAPLLLGETSEWPEDRRIFTRSPGWRAMFGADGVPASESVNVAFPGSVRTTRWRAVNEGGGWQLFDMQNDPGQRVDISAEHPEVTRQLAGSYDSWFDDVRKVPVVRPVIGIGHEEWPRARLAVPEAYFTGKVDWYNRWGFAHDWLTHWDDSVDRIWWEIEVKNPGKYRVSVNYACPESSVGTVLRVRTRDASAEGALEEAHAPNPVQRPTRIKKPRFVQTFREQALGEFDLEAGRTRLTLDCVRQVGPSICDVHSIVVERIAESR
ncbi:MAG: arylsulfatase [Verrucomicrobiae bacterium]|nr:arylsulfatase [Verrucomicrobiae bacterium]